MTATYPLKAAGQNASLIRPPFRMPWSALIGLVLLFTLTLNSCKKDIPASQPIVDTSIPTLTFPIASFASVTRFFPFGDPLLGNPANTGYQFILTDTSIRVISACSGIVTSITPSGNSSTIQMIYKKNSIYSFTYTGIGRVQVRVNDSVQPGAIIGVIVPQGLLSFSMVKNGNVALCPAIYGNQDFNTSIQVAINQNNIISPADSVVAPCVVDSLSF